MSIIMLLLQKILFQIEELFLILRTKFLWNNLFELYKIQL